MDYSIDFSFLDEPRLRQLVTQYHKESVLAYEQGLYAAAVVLCGATLEGVLTWALRNRLPPSTTDKSGRPVTEWTLDALIRRAAAEGIIGDAAEKASWAVKDFRNYIHPFKVIKGSSRADAALATSALSAAMETVRSLTGRLATMK